MDLVSRSRRRTSLNIATTSSRDHSRAGETDAPDFSSTSATRGPFNPLETSLSDYSETERKRERERERERERVREGEIA